MAGPGFVVHVHMAVRSRSNEVLQRLALYRADLNASCQFGLTPLVWAYILGHTSFAQKLRSLVYSPNNAIGTRGSLLRQNS